MERQRFPITQHPPNIEIMTRALGASSRAAAQDHTNAQIRAAKITADAEARIVALRKRADKEASAFEDAANAAVRAILQLGEPRAAVASLTGLTNAQVRAIEHAAPTATRTRHCATQQPDGHDTAPAETASERP
jgi:hypothetical protein